MDICMMADTEGATAHNATESSCGKIAYYVTGSGAVPWPAAQIAAIPADRGRVRIDQTPQLAAYAARQADVADVESGAGLIPAFAAATVERIGAGHDGWCYISRASVPLLAEALNAAKVPLGRVGLWVADWSLSSAAASELIGQKLSGMGVVAVQWASPASNPTTLLPGTHLDLKAANVDLSMALRSWFDAPHAPRKPAVTKEQATAALATLGAYIAES